MIRVGVIISTYNNPKWLEKTLWGYLYQDRMADEIVIADDGSRDETRELIDSFRDRLPIKHVWHEDRGFQKTQILNRAIVASSSDYLIFTDQDCIPRRDFISTHLAHAERGYMLSGGYYKLSMELSEAITEGDVQSGDAFDISWLKSKGMKIGFKATKLLRSTLFARFMNFITPAKASWNGCNSSGWRTDALFANGFNEQMQYGGEDREFGERLRNRGIRSKQLRYSAIVMHLDHKRPYKTKESISKNVEIRRNTRRTGITKTPHGIEQL